jgi:SAM-dependent methyltransferase
MGPPLAPPSAKLRDEELDVQGNRHDPTEFWDEAARSGQAWFVATGHRLPTSEFFSQGARETDTFLAFCGVTPSPGQTALEIGCGVGRMTRRLAELFARVIATDVSEEMRRRCRDNLADLGNIDYLQVPGDGSLPGVGNAEVDVVFSYVTLQHVPTPAAQLEYLAESARVLRTGGKLAVQTRSSSPADIAKTYAGHLVHLLQGRRTYLRAWRGSRVRPAVALRQLESNGISASARVWPAHPSWSPAHVWLVGTKLACEPTSPAAPNPAQQPPA